MLYGGSVPVIFSSMGETDLGHLQASQNLPSGFSYGVDHRSMRVDNNIKFLRQFLNVQ